MDSRYQILSNKKDLLYAEGSPVILCAKALTKDTSTNKVLAQIRFRNISRGTLTSLKVIITPKDVAGRKMDGNIQHVYLDIKVPRDGEFGANDPIYFSDATVRDYDVSIVEGIVDGNVHEVNQTLSVLSEPEVLRFSNSKMLGQYQKDIKCPKAKYWYRDIADLWQCTCGEFNHCDEAICYSCNIDRSVLQVEPDIQLMQEEMDRQEKVEREERERLEQRRQEEQAREQEELRAKKDAEQHARQRLAIKVGIAALLVCVVVVVARAIISAQKYNSIKNRVESLIAEQQYADADHLIAESKFKDEDKEKYYLQIINDLYADGNYTGTKEYVDYITSSSGKEKIAQLQTNYFLAGSFASKYELDELADTCLENGTVSQDQVNEITSSYEIAQVDQYIASNQWELAYTVIRKAINDKAISEDEKSRWAETIDNAIDTAKQDNQYENVLRFVELKDDNYGPSEDTANRITAIAEDAIADGKDSEVVELLRYKISTYGYDDETTVTQARTIAYNVMDSDFKLGCQLLMLVKDSSYIKDDPDEIVRWNTVASYMSNGRIPLRALVDARTSGLTTYPTEKVQTVVDRALYLLDKYQGTWKYYNGSTARYMYIDTDRFCWGDDTGAFKGTCLYDIDKDLIVGDSNGLTIGEITERDGQVSVSGNNPERVSYSALPSKFVAEMQ